MEAALPISEAAPERRAEALAAMGAAGQHPARPRTRRIALLTMAAAVLVGLGFVPIPMGRSKGALDRVLAAADHARNVYIRSVTYAGEGEAVSEEWIDEAGFSREEFSLDGGLVGLTLSVGAWETWFTPQPGEKPDEVMVTYDPCLLHPPVMPGREQFLRGFAIHAYVAELHGRPAPQVTLREYREASIWGGEVVVLEATETITEAVQEKQRNGSYAPFYQPGDTKVTRAEMDPDTGELLSVREYRVSSGEWTLHAETTYEWNVDIPEDLKHFDPPAGAKVTYNTWWEHRAEATIASGETQDWVFTVHTVDINRTGDITLSVSRVPTPEANPKIFNSGPGMVVEAVGSGGERYTQDSGFSCMNSRYVGYWTTTLHPEDPAKQPASLTFTVWPYDADPCADQSLVLRDVPLPPRQDVDDVMYPAR